MVIPTTIAVCHSFVMQLPQLHYCITDWILYYALVLWSSPPENKSEGLNYLTIIHFSNPMRAPAFLFSVTETILEMRTQISPRNSTAISIYYYYYVKTMCNKFGGPKWPERNENSQAWRLFSFVFDKWAHSRAYQFFKHLNHREWLDACQLLVI